ncbi:MAG: GtrA family protein [Candidatus Paceibacterota bacterium]
MLSKFLDNFKDRRLLFRYGISGLTGAFLSIVIFWLLERTGMWYPLAATGAFVVALFVNFLMQKFWTFGHKILGEIKREFVWYTGVAIFGLVANIALLHVFIERIHLVPLISQAIAVCIVSVINFLLNKNHTFKNHAHSYTDTNR